VEFTAIDQLVIAKTLVEDAQNALYGDIGVLYNTEGETTSGVLVDRVYYYYELKTVFSAIQDLSRQQDGFDFYIDVYYDPITGLPSKAFNTYYPRSGVAYNQPTPKHWSFSSLRATLWSTNIPKTAQLRPTQFTLWAQVQMKVN
jgi:hypothetical protein